MVKIEYSLTTPLQWRESGLDWVYLGRGCFSYNDAGETGIITEKTATLLEAIAKFICSMNTIRGKEFRYLRSHMEMTKDSLAHVLNTTSQVITIIENEADSIVPDDLAAPLRRLYLLRSLKVMDSTVNATVSSTEAVRQVVFEKLDENWYVTAIQ
jgi:DNA-binding XRE family transcriptional regulator